VPRQRLFSAGFGEQSKEADKNEGNEEVRTNSNQLASHLLCPGSGAAIFSASLFSPRDPENIVRQPCLLFAIPQIGWMKNDNFVIFDCLPDPPGGRAARQTNVCTVRLMHRNQLVRAWRSRYFYHRRTGRRTTTFTPSKASWARE
jgi:hypothetical protein